MLFQDIPAQTTNYMVAGYTVIFGVMFFYVISLIVRRRNLKKDLAVLEDLAKE
jgi:CcmD family protein